LVLSSREESVVSDSGFGGRRKTMRLGIGVALALTAGLCGTVAAQDGGKIPWKAKGKDDDVKAHMAQAQKDGKAIMLFFTSEG
jgi:hypothetical protein